MSTSKKPKIIVAVALVLLAAVIVGIALNARGLLPFGNKAAEKTTAETTAEATTAGAKPYVVDFEKERELKAKEIFADDFQDVKESSFSKPSQEAKETYWEAVEKEEESRVVVNRYLLCSLAASMTRLGFDLAEVKPSECCRKDGSFTDKGIKTLKAVKKFFFSDEFAVWTASVAGEAAKKYYNSRPGEDGVIYADRIGIKAGNMACWCFAKVSSAVEDVDEFFEHVYNGAKDVKNVIERQLVRCGNVISENPPKKETPETTTSGTTRRHDVPATGETPSLPTVSITVPSKPWTLPTLPPKESTTKPRTTEAKTKNEQENPVHQGKSPSFEGWTTSKNNSGSGAGKQQTTAALPPSEYIHPTTTTTRAAATTTTTKAAATTAIKYEKEDHASEPPTRIIEVVTDSNGSATGQADFVKPK